MKMTDRGFRLTGPYRDGGTRWRRGEALIACVPDASNPVSRWSLWSRLSDRRRFIAGAFATPEEAADALDNLERAPCPDGDLR